MDDEKIVALFWERSEEALHQTASRYGAYCHRIAFNILRNQEDAEECVNEAYWRTWESIPPHKPQGLAAFIGKITRNLALDCLEKKHAQKRSRHTEIILDELAEVLPDSDSLRAPSDDIALKDAINGFLATLPDRTRVVFLRRYWYLDTVKQIARQLGMSESNVKITLFRTREQFKAYLRKEGIEV